MANSTVTGSLREASFPILSSIFPVRPILSPNLDEFLTTRVDFYTKNELPLRLALFWMSAQVCTVLGSFLAFGVLRMRGLAGREGWR